MELVLPPSPASDWHVVLHLTLYPEWSKLSSYHYNLSRKDHFPSKQLFSPRILQRPQTEWDAIQSLSYGIDILCGQLYS